MIPLLTQPELDAFASVCAKEAARLKFQTPCDIGHVFQRERIVLLAERCCQQLPGDLIEVGSYSGATSVLLADIARKYGRKLVCVDNFVNRDDFELESVGREFAKAIEPFADVIEWLNMDAHDARTIELIQGRRYCWAFSDDGHDYVHHVAELEALLPVVDGMIAVDDVYVPGVREAISDTLKKFPGWTWLQADGLSEDWLVIPLDRPIKATGRKA